MVLTEGFYATDEASLKDALAGNLCRCTGYGPILSAGAAMGPDPDADDQDADDQDAADRDLCPCRTDDQDDMTHHDELDVLRGAGPDGPDA